MKNTIVLTLFLFVVVGCSTPAYFSVPNQRFESPTVSGKTLSGGVGVGIDSPTYIVVVKDIEVTPPESSGSEITLSGHSSVLDDLTLVDKLVFDLRLGLGERFEISMTGPIYHLKYQFLGSPRVSAKGGEWVGSLVGDYFSGSRRRDSGVSSNHFETEYMGSGGSLVMGYRRDKDIIIYLSASHLNFSADTKVVQVSPSGTFNYSDKGSQQNASLGIRREEAKGFYAALEWSYSKTEWASLEAKEYGSVGLILGGSW